MSNALIGGTGSGWGGEQTAGTNLNEQANERAYNALAEAGGDLSVSPTEALDGIERDIYMSSRGAEDITRSRKDELDINRRLHNAKGAYKAAVEAAKGDASKIDRAVVAEYHDAEAAHANWLAGEEMSAEHNRKNAEARALRDLAEDGDRTLLRLITHSARSKRSAHHALYSRSEIVEHKPPVPVASDSFGVRFQRGAVGEGRIAGTKTMNGYSDRAVIYCPEEFHDDVNSLIGRAAFWQGLGNGNVAQALAEAGGAYGKLSRAAASTDSGAWAGKIYFTEFWELMGSQTPWFNPDVAKQVPSDRTDKMPAPAVDAPPAGGWVPENGSITLDDMETKVREFDAYCYAVATDISHKYMNNSWYEQLGYANALKETQIAKAAIDVGLQMTRGTGVADISPSGILQTIGSVSRNKIQNLVKASDLKAADLIEAMWQLDYAFRRNPMAAGQRTLIMANGDTLSQLEIESGSNRYMNTGDEAWLDTSPSYVRYPEMMGIIEQPFVPFYLRQYACVENPDFEDMDASKFTSLLAGKLSKSLSVRRSSIYQAVVPVNVMIGGQTKLQERHATWFYTDILQTQDNSLRGTSARGPAVVIQPNKS